MSKDNLSHLLKMDRRREACQRIRCTSLGPTADQEGWLHGLIDFVAKHDRMPDHDEQKQLADVAMSIRNSMDALALLKPQPKVKGWQALGGSGALSSLRTMRKKMTDKAYREVFGEFTPPAPKDPDPEQDAYAEAMAAAPVATPAVLPKGFV